MENLETYFYVFFAVIYIISRIIKARSKQKQQKKPVVTPQQHATPQPMKSASRPKKAFSFDDILKEFEKNLSGEELTQEEAFPVQETKHEEPAPIAVETIEEKSYPLHGERHRTNKYENKRIEQESPVFKRNEKFTIKESIASEYVKMLQDPEGFRNAVVLSEIINRKYY